MINDNNSNIGKNDDGESSRFDTDSLRFDAECDQKFGISYQRCSEAC